MAKKKADLEGAALSSLLGTPAPPPPSASPANTSPRGATVAGVGDGADAERTDAEGYARTTTGYRRESGEHLRRLSLFLTERQRQELKRQAAGSENVTEYVVEALGLNRGTR